MSEDTYSGNVQTLPRASVNGHAQDSVPDARGKRVANRAPWVSLPEPWDNIKFRGWLDYPQDVADLLTAPKDETPEAASARVMDFLKSVILQHDGWVLDDEDEINPETGKAFGPLPQPDTDEFWQRISTPLGRKISERFFEELTQNPTSRASRRAKRRNFQKR